MTERARQGSAPGAPAARIAYGGDYNPEQWPEEVWAEDVRLMREAHVTLVTLGVFSWGLLELDDDVWDFGWLDRVLDLLHEGGIAVDLATPTAAPPIWLHRAHPEILPVARSGLRYHQGGRLQWCPSSPVWRQYSSRVVRVLAERYAAHPAVAMWHVGNEFGGGNRRCYCDASSAHFRRWLADRYGTIEALNAAWGTAFWGSRYGSFEQVVAPLDSESAQNPGLLLDFDRFSSDALLGQFTRERDLLRAAGVTVPVTTNLMVGSGPGPVDSARWAPELDVVATDHYTVSSDPRRERELGYCADRTRGLSGGRPWLLMEHSTSAVNWQQRNRSKEPGELLRNSLQHVARGADGALFFQWRASRAGSEQFHSAMLPHAGTRSRVWREVVQLGAALDALRPVAGTVVEPAQVAVLADDVAGWAWQAGQKPLHGDEPWLAARRWNEVLADRGVLSDVLPRTGSLDGYRVIVVAGLYLVDDDLAERIAAAAAGGATVVVSARSGIADADNSVRTGGHPGAFRALLGAFAEEIRVLQEGETVALDDGGVAVDWTESVVVDGADVLARYGDGVLAAQPAITRREVGRGSAWYLSADLDAPSLARFAERVLTAAGVQPTVPVVAGVEAVRRRGATGSFLFLINHGAVPAAVPVAGHELLTGTAVGPLLELGAGRVAVVREHADQGRREASQSA